LAGILEQTPEGIVIPEVLSVLWVWYYKLKF
jgi:hypothetical protein